MPSSRGTRKNTRVSVGLACVRAGPRELEMLLIRRRNSYAFEDFVLGKYDSANDAQIRGLFSETSTDEKIVMRVFNFARMWSHMWLGGTPSWANYSVCHSKFAQTFYGAAGEARFKRLLAGSKDSPRIWSTPKGRREPGESDIQGAIREFYEETLIPKDGNYQVLPGLRHEYSHVSNGIKYVVITYTCVAYSAEQASSRILHAPALDINNYSQLSEVDAIAWMSINRMKYTPGAERIIPQAKIILSRFRNFRRKAFSRVPAVLSGPQEDPSKKQKEYPGGLPGDFPEDFPEGGFGGEPDHLHIL